MGKVKSEFFLYNLQVSGFVKIMKYIQRTSVTKYNFLMYRQRDF